MHAALLFLLGADTLLGTWRGESVCVKADWNASCKDEKVEYEAVRAKDPGVFVVHGRKLVGGEYQSMGDVEFRYDAADKAWTADFENERVHLHFRFAVQGDELTGTVDDVSGKRVQRHMRAHRQKGS